MGHNADIPFADQWKPDKEDLIFTNIKDIIIAPISSYYHLGPDQDSNIDYFWLKLKRVINQMY